MLGSGGVLTREGGRPMVTDNYTTTTIPTTVPTRHHTIPTPYH